MKNRLNIRQKRFVENYLLAPHDTAGCYMRAGYKCRDNLTATRAANNLLKHPAVATEIAQRQAQAAEETNVTMRYVTSRLYTVVERCMQTQPVLDVLGNPTGIYEFRPMAAVKALDQLARILGGYNDKLQVEQKHTHTHTLSLQEAGVTVQELRATLEALRQRKTLPSSVVLEHKPSSLASPPPPEQP